MRLFRTALIVSALIAGPAIAEKLLDPSVLRVHEIAAEFGPATVVPANDSFPLPSIEAEAEGLYYFIVMVECIEEEDCGYAEFSASFTVDRLDDGVLNTWNSDNRIGTAYLGDGPDANVILSHTVRIGEGVTVDTYETMLEIWIDTLDNFSNYLYEAERQADGMTSAK